MNNLVVYLAYVAYKLKLCAQKWQRAPDVYSLQQQLCLTTNASSSMWIIN
jgi:hypothetical protein